MNPTQQYCGIAFIISDVSQRNAYRIGVTTRKGYKYELLRQRLNDLFKGHVEETDDGFFAEDSPGVGSTFLDGDARYVQSKDFQRAMTAPFFDGWGDSSFYDAKDEWDALEDADPNDVGHYADIIKYVEHVYANDTSGERRTDNLSLQ